MQIQTPSIYNYIQSLSKTKAEPFACKKVPTGVPMEITEPCQIILGKDFYLNSRNSRITEGLATKDSITIGSDKSCNIQTSKFHDGIEKTHITITKDNDKLFLTDNGITGETHIVSKENIKPLFESKYIKVFDLQYGENRHYYNATRRSLENLVAVKSDEEFRNMLPDAVTCVVILKIKLHLKRMSPIHQPN